MNPARVATRGLVTANPRGARLSDYSLAFNKVSLQHADVAHANIMYARGETVEGVLYDLSEAREILKMDPFERAPWNYGRDAVCLETDTGLEWAWTYFANAAMIQTGRLPPQEYLDHLLAGAPYLSDSYVQRLRNQPVAS